MKEKSERIKSRSRVITNRNIPPVWQNDVSKETQQIKQLHGVSRSLQPPPILSPFMARYQQNQTSDDFLEIMAKYVEERMKSHSETD